jgi:hypothetical protein
MKIDTFLLYLAQVKVTDRISTLYFHMKTIDMAFSNNVL